MRRVPRSFDISTAAVCGDRVGKKWLLFMRRIYDLDLAREIATAEGPGALVVDDGPKSWAILVLDRPARPISRLASHRHQTMGPADSRKQTTLFDST
jgi:hypothetical protein